MRLRSILIMVGVLTILAAAFVFLRSKPEVQPAQTPRTFIWWVEMDEICGVRIDLPRQGKRQAWVKREDSHFYFDEPGGSVVDGTRWGGGIPLLLSGPAAIRSIAEQATDEQREIYGLREPAMTVDLCLEDGGSLRVEIGNRTPDQQAYYISRSDSREVYTVDYTWYQVLANLVLDPPYPQSARE